MTDQPFISYEPRRYNEDETAQRVQEYHQYMALRRSIREFSDRPVPKQVIEQLIMTASSAPSGAHKQPWTFCAVADPAIKKEIRKAAEEEEYISYNGRMSDEWLKDLQPFQTNWHKPFLEIAPWLIIVFKKAYDFGEEGKKLKNYYVNESVGLAAGFLLKAIHQAGLVALTHTPSPMNFLQKILKRPENERPFLLIPVGYPADEVKVPALTRKGPQDVIVYYE
ncbi:MAG: nitroreductase family protein [Bacteroidota bacterium]